MTSDPIYIIGLDLGDGESSIAYLSVEEKGEPQVFECEPGERSMITTLALSLEGDHLIGKDALFEEGVKELVLNFKHEPTFDPIKWQRDAYLLRTFAEQFYARFVKAYPEVIKNARVYLGHPSSWPPTSVDNYSALFQGGPILRAFKVVPESRSALIHAHDYNKRISKESLDSVLVIDIGSSTTDFTYLESLKPWFSESNDEGPEFPIGVNFGAKLIDQAILEHLKEQCPNSQELDELLAVKKPEKAYLLYLCRKAKEQHFSRFPFVPEPRKKSFKELVERYWPLLENLDGQMDAILARSIGEFPNGWKVGFRDLLLEAQERIKPASPKVILLTGGGSRMSFTKDLCREVFPSASVDPDRNPSLSVAKGLVGFGRWRYRVDGFREALNEFYESGELDEEIRRNLETIIKDASTCVYSNFVDKVFRPMAYALQNGELTSKEIGDVEKYCRQKFLVWLKSSQGREAQKLAMRESARILNAFIKQKTDAISERFAIPKKSLQLHLELLLIEEYYPFHFFPTDSYKVLEWLIKRTEKIVSVENRKKVPKFVIETFLKSYEGFGKSVFIESTVEFERKIAKMSSDTRNLLVTKVREQIKSQLEEQAREAEWLLM